MSFPGHFLDELRTRLSITDVVGRRVSWDRAKSNARRKDYWACCPFHSEKSPSFHVDETKGFYHCFGCGAHGDIIGFVKDMDNLSFIETVERLAADAGLQMPERTPQMREAEEKRAGLVDIMEMAAAFFEKALMQSTGQEARRYLDGRNLDRKTWATFRLGYAPNHPTALSDRLLAEGVKPAQIVEAGLAFELDGGGMRDRFRGRIIFPIMDARSRVIAFGGRALSANAKAKYLNSPETPLFHKGRTLYNIATARRASADLARSDNVHRLPGVIVAEGYMDVIALCIAGFPQSVAPLGTAMTEEQIMLAWKMTPEPVLCFDGDAAGIKAAGRAMERALPLLRPGHSLGFVLLPGGLDPDDVIRENGAEAMRALVAKPLSLIDFLWQREIEDGPFDTPEKRAALEERFDQAANQIKDDKVQRFYRQALRDRLYKYFNARKPTARSKFSGRDTFGRGTFGRGGQQAGGVTSALRKSSLAQASRLASRVSGGMGVGRDLDLYVERERVLVATVLRFPELLDNHGESFAGIILERPELDQLRREILNIAASGELLDKDTLTNHLSKRGASHLAEQLLRHAGQKHTHIFSASAELADAEKHWSHVLAIHRDMVSLRREAKEAEVLFQQDGSKENWQRLQQIQTQLQQATVIQSAQT